MSNSTSQFFCLRYEDAFNVMHFLIQGFECVKLGSTCSQMPFILQPIVMSYLYRELNACLLEESFDYGCNCRMTVLCINAICHLFILHVLFYLILA